MPPLPTITNVYRITLDWAQADGVAPRNVFHVRGTPANVTDLGDAIDDALGTLVNNELFAVMNSSQLCSSFSILPLDGVTGTVVHGITDPLRGAGSSSIIPQGAVVMSFHTAVRGPRGRGRMYIGPVREDVVSGGLVDGATLAGMVTHWGDFFDALVAGSPSLEFGIASYEHAQFNPVTSHRGDLVMGTQRRRRDQLL